AAVAVAAATHRRARRRTGRGQRHRGHRVTVDQLTDTGAELRGAERQRVTVGLAPVVRGDRQRRLAHRQLAGGVTDREVTEAGAECGRAWGRVRAAGEGGAGRRTRRRQGRQGDRVPVDQTCVGELWTRAGDGHTGGRRTVV